MTHAPTGAVFWMGEKDILNCEWSQTALPSGHDYDRHALKEVAREIFLKERSACFFHTERASALQHRKLSPGDWFSKPYPLCDALRFRIDIFDAPELANKRSVPHSGTRCVGPGNQACLT